MRKIRLYASVILLVYSLQLIAYHNYVFQFSVPKSGTYLLLKLVKFVIKKPDIQTLSVIGNPKYIICGHTKATQGNIQKLKWRNY